jgi:hypothetical protein
MPEEPTGQELMEDQDQSDMPTDEDQDGLPEETKERTREQFEKLKEANRKLKEELEANKQPQPSVLDSLNPGYQPVNNYQAPSANAFSHLNQQQVESISEKLINKGEDGYDYVNTQALERALKDANDRAARAEEQARMAAQRFNKFEESAQIREAYSKYPQLDPNGDQFSEAFYSNVRDKLIAQAFRGEKDLVKAADEVARLIQPVKAHVKEPVREEEAQTKKEQINATGTATSRYSSADFEALKSGTLRGQKGALAERLRRSGY